MKFTHIDKQIVYRCISDQRREYRRNEMGEWEELLGMSWELARNSNALEEAFHAANKRILVVAYNQHQAENYARRHLEGKRWKYVSKAEDLRGLLPSHIRVILVGEYYNNSRWDAINAIMGTYGADLEITY